MLPTFLELLKSPRDFFVACVSRSICRANPITARFATWHALPRPAARQWAEALSAHIHAHFGTNSATVVTLARVLGAPPYSFTVHGPEEFMCPLALDEKIHGASFVVAISSFGRASSFSYRGSRTGKKSK